MESWNGRRFQPANDERLNPASGFREEEGGKGAGVVVDRMFVRHLPGTMNEHG